MSVGRATNVVPVMVLAASLGGCAASSAAPARETARDGGSGRMEVVTLESRVFDNARSLRVWLPAGYDDPANRPAATPCST